MSKKTVVIGASAKSDRYSNRAVRMLKQHGHEAIALGFEQASIEGTPIETEWGNYDEVDTVTLYLNPNRRKPFTITSFPCIPNASYSIPARKTTSWKTWPGKKAYNHWKPVPWCC